MLGSRIPYRSTDIRLEDSYNRRNDALSPAPSDIESAVFVTGYL